MAPPSDTKVPMTSSQATLPTRNSRGFLILKPTSLGFRVAKLCFSKAILSVKWHPNQTLCIRKKILEGWQITLWRAPLRHQVVRMSKLELVSNRTSKTTPTARFQTNQHTSIQCQPFKAEQKKHLVSKPRLDLTPCQKLKKMTWWWIWPRDANLKCLIMAATVWKDAGPAETWNGQWKPCKTCWTLWQKFAMSTWPGLCLCFRLPLWESFRFGASFGNCSFGDL